MNTFKDKGKRRKDAATEKNLREIRKLRRTDGKQNRYAIAALYAGNNTTKTKTVKET